MSSGCGAGVWWMSGGGSLSKASIRSGCGLLGCDWCCAWSGTVFHRGWVMSDGAASWKMVSSRQWTHQSSHMVSGEARSIAWAAKHALRSSDCFGSGALVAAGSLVNALALAKFLKVDLALLRCGRRLAQSLRLLCARELAFVAAGHRPTTPRPTDPRVGNPSLMSVVGRSRPLANCERLKCEPALTRASRATTSSPHPPPRQTTATLPTARAASPMHEVMKQASVPEETFAVLERKRFSGLQRAWERHNAAVRSRHRHE